jgi:hypothetical protein
MKQSGSALSRTTILSCLSTSIAALSYISSSMVSGLSKFMGGLSNVTRYAAAVS